MKLIETINSSIQSALPTLSRINLGNVDKSICQNTYNYNGVDTITLKQKGYYLVLFKADLTSTATTQQMQVGIIANGTPSTLVESSVYATASGEVQTTAFQKIVKVCNEPLVLQFQNSGAVATTISNVIVSVVKIA